MRRSHRVLALAGAALIATGCGATGSPAIAAPDGSTPQPTPGDSAGTPSPARAPPRPTAVVASAGLTTVAVSWVAPVSDGGAPISGYVVVATPPAPSALVLVAGTSATVTGLARGTTYTFTVAATNAAGTSAPSEPSSAVTTLDVPVAVGSVVATAADRSANVTWSAPPSDGGTALTGYTVLVSPATPPASVSVTGTGARVTSLLNGTAYTFRVLATNALGDGPTSAPSPSVTPFGLPGAPSALDARGGNAQATVTWTAPDPNGAAITGYVVTSAPGGLTASVTESPAVVSGLANGTPYTFTVVAVNAAGRGVPSASSPAVTPMTAPGAPTGVVGVPTPAGATLSWAAPASDGGSRVTGYSVLASPPADGATVTVTGTGTTAVVTGLVPGTAYAFRVTARNAAGEGPASAASDPVTPAPIAAIAGLTVFPPVVSLPLDRDVQLAALATLQDGTTSIVTLDAAWSSNAAGAVAVTAGKLAPDRSAGIGATATITARYGGRSATAAVTLVAASAGIGPGFDTDPLLEAQWHLRNTGQSAYAANTGTSGNDIGALATYQAGIGGRGVKIAVVDSGLEIAHEDLSANVAEGSWNFATSTSDPTATTTSGDHGTSVAGLVAAVRANGKGGMGVAPSARLNGYNLLASLSTQTTANRVAALGGGNGPPGPTSADVWIFNQSHGVSTVFPLTPSSTLEAQYLDGVTHLRGGLGALYVKSAGNGFQGYGASSPPDCSGAREAHVSCENASMDPSNTFPMNVVVGALNALGTRSSYSTAGSALWVSAPGGEYGLSGAITCSGAPCPGYYFDPAMITTDQSGCAAGYAVSTATGSPFDAGGTGNPSCNYTNTFNGTSSAAPVVSGAIALLLEANPSLGWRDVKAILAATARQVDAAIPAVTVSLGDGTYTIEPGWLTNVAGYRFHDWYGFGALDVDAAVALARSWIPGRLGALRDTGWLAGTVRGSGAIPDAAVAGASADVTVGAALDLEIEAVQLQVSIVHEWLGDVAVELTSPSGTRSVLLNARSGFGSTHGSTVTVQLLSNAFLGERSSGTWTVKVVDAWSGDSGTLAGVDLRVYGH